MNFFNSIKRWIASRKSLPLDQWYFVVFDNDRVSVRVNPQGKPGWEQSFPWSTVIRVCFKDEGPWLSDGIYIFTSLRPESFVIPVEASGGDAFFKELLSRKLFPDEIAAKAMTSTDGGFYCWPSETSTRGS